ncbi:unnamed protein product [Symbiodinium sp. CCMP2456]|nr:unnamed protein product [Symbiodinium sp. CCMP2456]
MVLAPKALQALTDAIKHAEKTGAPARQALEMFNSKNKRYGQVGQHALPTCFGERGKHDKCWRASLYIDIEDTERIFAEGDATEKRQAALHAARNLLWKLCERFNVDSRDLAERPSSVQPAGDLPPRVGKLVPVSTIEGMKSPTAMLQAISTDLSMAGMAGMAPPISAPRVYHSDADSKSATVTTAICCTDAFLPDGSFVSIFGAGSGECSEWQASAAVVRGIFEIYNVDVKSAEKLETWLNTGGPAKPAYVPPVRISLEGACPIAESPRMPVKGRPSLGAMLAAFKDEEEMPRSKDDPVTWVKFTPDEYEYVSV